MVSPSCALWTPPPPCTALHCFGKDPLIDEKNAHENYEKARVYGSTFVCLTLLERWYELGIRPEEETMRAMLHVVTTRDAREVANKEGTNQSDSASYAICNCSKHLWNNPVDDLQGLQNLIGQVRRLLWQRAPDPATDEHLQVRASQIPGAQKGLFAVRDIPQGTVCCFSTGDVHSVASSQKLDDASYLLRIGPSVSRPWWYKAMLGDENILQVRDFVPATNDDDLDEDRVVPILLQEWDKMVESWSPPVFFVNPSNLAIKARYINDCLNPHLYNVTFAMDPAGERAAVLTLRDIRAGEELYVMYGQAYWDTLEARTGIIPKALIVPTPS